MKKEEKKKLEQLKDKERTINRRIQDLEYKEMVEDSLPALRKVVGKVYKYHNSYGGDHERWWLYVKVLSVNEKDMSFMCVEFQRTSMARIEIVYEAEYNWRGGHKFDSMDYIEITQAEYNRAKKAAKKFIIEKLDM